MADITYTDPFGGMWNLTARGVSGPRVCLAADGLEGLVGATEKQSVSTVGTAGYRVTGHNIVEMGGTLRTMCIADDAESVAQLARRWRAAWSHHSPGQLSIDGTSLGRLTASVRLHETPAPPANRPGSARVLYVDVAVAVDDGLWWTGALGGEGTVEVSNPGAVMIRPQIRWKGAGGVVVLPSGAVFTLPSTTFPRLLSLDNAESCVVTDERGRVDRRLWKQLAAQVLPEGVPPGQRREYRLPAGARLEWRVGVLDPWI